MMWKEIRKLHKAIKEQDVELGLEMIRQTCDKAIAKEYYPYPWQNLKEATRYFETSRRKSINQFFNDRADRLVELCQENDIEI